MFTRLMLFLCVIVYTMWSGKSLQLLCILLLVCCACLPSVMFEKILVGSVYVGGYGGLSECRLCVFRELCPVSFLVVGERLSALL